MKMILLLVCTALVQVGCARCSTTTTGNPTQVAQFMRRAREAFAKTPAGQTLSVQDLSDPGALGKDWKLDSTGKYADRGTQYPLFGLPLPAFSNSLFYLLLRQNISCHLPSVIPLAKVFAPPFP